MTENDKINLKNNNKMKSTLILIAFFVNLGQRTLRIDNIAKWRKNDVTKSYKIFVLDL